MRPDIIFKQNGIWYVWDETWTSNYGPFYSKWEAEKFLSLYCYFEGGLGFMKPLYLDLKRTVDCQRWRF